LHATVVLASLTAHGATAIPLRHSAPGCRAEQMYLHRAILLFADRRRHSF
jgi:hypothetical protein